MMPQSKILQGRPEIPPGRSMNERIRRAFSQASLHYDVLTSLHKEIGRELLAKAAEKESVGAVLDVGMGTGWLTARLKNDFPGARVVGLDAAEGMIEAARHREEDFCIVQADAGFLPFQSAAFDLIVSNLAYQWVGSLPAAFAECRRVLKEEGRLHLTMFGRETFREVFEALAKTREDGKPLALGRLPGKEDIAYALKSAGLGDVRVEEEIIRAHFPDMTAILQWVKDIGANALAKEMFVGKDWLTRAGAYYQENFRDRWGVAVTFEVIWVEAKK